jgi:hypothetical protein
MYCNYLKKILKECEEPRFKSKKTSDAILINEIQLSNCIKIYKEFYKSCDTNFENYVKEKEIIKLIK